MVYKITVFQDDDSRLGADNKTSTRFDHNFSITDFLKINLGTKVALRLVSVYRFSASYVAAFFV